MGRNEHVPVLDITRRDIIIAQLNYLVHGRLDGVKHRLLQSWMMPNEFLDGCANQNRILFLLQDPLVALGREDRE